MLLLISLAGFALFALSAGASVSERVVQGEMVEHGEIPWQLTLHTDAYFCGAVAIAKNIVLTAAHCVDDVEDAPQMVSIGCGVHDLYEYETESQVAVATRIVTHESWDHYKLLNDIAIIHVDPPFKWDQFCQRARLPPNNGKDYASENGTVSGWGRISENGPASRYLLKAVIPVITNTECDKIWYLTDIPDSYMCARDPSLVHDTCFGDSGGPLTTVDHHTGATTLVGLTSFGIGCAPTFGSVYTRVSYYLDWINGKMDELGAMQEE